MPPVARPKPSSVAMEADVLQMEQRLADLKANMSKEREKRDAQRQKNPTGSVWKSARSDAPVNSAKYASQVLKEGGRQPTPPTGGAPQGQHRRPMDAAQTRLLEPSSLYADAKPSSFGQASYFGKQQQQQAAPSGGADLDFGATRPNFEWSVGVAQDNNNDYEDLLGPIDASDPAPPSSFAPPAHMQQQQAPPPAGPGSLLQGSFDEDESAESFQDALRAFRGEAPVAKKPGFNWQQKSAPRAQPLAAVAESSSSGGGGALLQGSFDEDESAESFQDALRAFRGEAPRAAPQRASRFTVQPAAPPASKPSEPTLADKIHCLKTELGLDMSSTMAETVRAANGAVGLDNIGSLTDQVGRLLRETGITAVRGSAPGASGGSPQRPGSGRARPLGVSAGTATDTGDGEGGSLPGSRPSSSHGVMTTQTQPQTSIYERYLEQKKKDGLA